MAVTPDDVIKLGAATEGFLCPLSANTYNIEFLEFVIRDTASGKILFEVRRPPGQESAPPHALDGLSPEEEKMLRVIRYKFGADFLDHKQIGTSLTFSIGDQPLKDFRMIERHYFRDRLLKSFDFTLNFCIPNSRNNWEVMYELPELSDAEKREMIAAPFETKSDSFYFVDNVLVMHNKAEYSYSP